MCPCVLTWFKFTTNLREAFTPWAIQQQQPVPPCLISGVTRVTASGFMLGVKVVNGVKTLQWFTCHLEVCDILLVICAVGLVQLMRRP